MKNSGFGAHLRLVMDYLIGASQVVGHPRTADVLDKAEFYLEHAALYARLPSERDMIAAVRGMIDALSDRNEDALALFERVPDLDAEPEPVEE